MQAKVDSGASGVLLALELATQRCFCANVGSAMCLLSRISGALAGAPCLQVMLLTVASLSSCFLCLQPLLPPCHPTAGSFNAKTPEGFFLTQEHTTR